MGDIVIFKLNLMFIIEQLLDGQDYYFVMYGFVVMVMFVMVFENEMLNFVVDDSCMGYIVVGLVCLFEVLFIMLGEFDVFL